MSPIRRRGLLFLAVAIALPVTYMALLALNVYWNYYRRGLPFEGKGAVVGVIVVVACASLFWITAAVHYLVSLFREPVSLTFGRALEASLFFLSLWGIVFLLQSTLFL